MSKKNIDIINLASSFSKQQTSLLDRWEYSVVGETKSNNNSYIWNVNNISTYSSINTVYKVPSIFIKNYDEMNQNKDPKMISSTRAKQIVLKASYSNRCFINIDMARVLGYLFYELKTPLVIFQDNQLYNVTDIVVISINPRILYPDYQNIQLRYVDKDNKPMNRPLKSINRNVDHSICVISTQYNNIKHNYYIDIAACQYDDYSLGDNNSPFIFKILPPNILNAAKEVHRYDSIVKNNKLMKESYVNMREKTTDPLLIQQFTNYLDAYESYLTRYTKYIQYLNNNETENIIKNAYIPSIRCNFCNLPALFEGEFKVCSRCKNIRYCCYKHQKNDWKNHKLSCNNPDYGADID